MNYRVLQDIIESVIARQTCPRCGIPLYADVIDLWALYHNRVILSARCSCSTSLCILISEKGPFFGDEECLQHHGLKAMTVDEFLALREKLKHLETGFSGLFE